MLDALRRDSMSATLTFRLKRDTKTHFKCSFSTVLRSLRSLVPIIGLLRLGMYLSTTEMLQSSLVPMIGLTLFGLLFSLSAYVCLPRYCFFPPDDFLTLVCQWNGRALQWYAGSNAIVLHRDKPEGLGLVC